MKLMFTYTIKKNLHIFGISKAINRDQADGCTKTASKNRFQLVDNGFKGFRTFHDIFYK